MKNHPKGTRYCENCNALNIGVQPNGEPWNCNECGASHLPRKMILERGDRFPLNQSFVDATRFGIKYVPKD